MNVILIATTNRGKLKEIREIFKDFDTFSGGGSPIKLITPDDLDAALDVVEDGKTYAENAALKALAYSQQFLMLTLADDSGLEVDVLDGRPGLRSARYSGVENATDADRRAYLLAELQGYPQPWTARFRCIVAIALPDGTVYYSEGSCQGEISAVERGTRGFGYDPIFQVADEKYGGRTMAELNLAQKNTLSHRANALRGAFPILSKLFAQAR